MTLDSVIIICLCVLNAGLGVALILFFRYAKETVVRDTSEDLADHEARCVERYQDTSNTVTRVLQNFEERLENVETRTGLIEKQINLRKRNVT